MKISGNLMFYYFTFLICKKDFEVHSELDTFV
jgi:hypothetical protein